MSQVDPSLEEASRLLRARSPRTLARVVLPLMKPAIVAALTYGFVRAVTTVSAVVFLVSAEYDLATTYIIGRVVNGDYGVAIAYCAVLIVLMVAVVGLIEVLVGTRRLGRRVALAPARARSRERAQGSLDRAARSDEGMGLLGCRRSRLPRHRARDFRDPSRAFGLREGPRHCG
jgi:hypothetical protein